MLSNFIKLNTGRTNIKIIATILVITLTFANFALLGTYLGETLAADASGDTKTNVGNVEFEIYLDQNDKTKTEESLDINSQELNLYATVAVKNEGRLENAKINFADSNFELKENANIKEQSVETIVAGTEKTFTIPLVARKDVNYNLDLLNMESKIVLTGDYIYENGNVETVNTEKKVTIEWNTNSITNEDLEISQEVITNKIYNIEGTEKRVLQLLVKDNIKESKAPLKQQTIEINNPIENPESVKVAVKQINGKQATYTNDSTKTTINILNNPSEQNTVAWAKNSSDEFIITYIYSKDVEITPFVSDVKTEAQIYGTENASLEQTSNLTLNEIETQGDVILLEKNIPNELYKGYMYEEEDTNYQTKEEMFVSYSDALENLELSDSGEAIESDALASYFKETKISKAEAQELFGAEGTIKIYNSNDMENVIKEINLSEETQEENYVITYSQEVQKITIQTSKPVKEGKLEIINQKTIKPLDVEKIEETTSISSIVNLTANKQEDQMLFYLTKSAQIELKEPVLTIETFLNKETISTQVEETLRITEVLESTKAENKLFKNPTLNIELPQDFTDVQIENISLVDEELQIDSYQVLENNILEVKISGEQTKHSSNALGGPNIVIDLKLKTNSFMANKNVEIKTTCINNEEEANTAKAVTLVSKNGIITKNAITVGENTVEEINNDNIIAKLNGEETTANISTKLINNYGENIKNVSIIGTVKTNLLGEITTSLDDAVITYSEDLNTWSKNVEDYSTIKAFKIEKQNELENTQEIQISYQANITDYTPENEISTIDIKYDLNEQNLSKKINYTLVSSSENIELKPVEQQETGTEDTPVENPSTINYSAEISLKSKTTTGVLHEGQIVTYIVSVKNTGDTTINNAKLEYAIPRGTACVELKYKDGYEIDIIETRPDVQAWDIETLNPGETFSKEVSIKIDKGTTEIVNKVRLINNQNETAAELISNPIEVKEAQIEVVMYKRGLLDEILREGDFLEYFVDVKNVTQNTLKNIVVEVNVPENTVYNEENMYNEGWSFNQNKNKIYYTIEELPAGETTKLIYALNVDEITEERNIENAVIVKTENEEQYESNHSTVKAKEVKIEFNMTASSNISQINKLEDITYKITIKNVGNTPTSGIVVDEFPSSILVRNAYVYVNGNIDYSLDIFNNNILEVPVYLEAGDTVEIEALCLTSTLDDTVKEVNVDNFAKLTLQSGEYIETNKINSTITNPDWQENITPTDNEDQEQEKTYSISGLAWIDANKNGIRDLEEEILKDINVILLDEQGNTVKDEKGNAKQTQTTINGTYKFSNLKPGNYTVVFVYDSTKYEVTKYQVNGASQNTNSDAIEKTLKIEGEDLKVAVTELIKLVDADITNIDLGLIKNAVFDLSLDKYVDKIVVTNNGGTSTYSFNTETSLAKVEISAKYIANSVILVEYSLNITNEGNVNGYVEDLMDYVPNDFTFSSDLNPDWYLDQSGNLHNNTLAKTAIKPGETAKVKLVLTKTTTGQAVTLTNEAEIGLSSNLEEINEQDSVAGNNKQAEDDYGKAQLIVSIATGSIGMYIGIVIASLVLLGGGIYLINKKVLKGGI